MTTGRLWKQDIFGCCENIEVCICAFICWPLYNGCVYCRVRSNYSRNGKCTSCFRSICCLCFGDAYNRKLFRENYNITGNYCNDCLTSCLCPCCAIAQVDMENIKIKEEKTNNKPVKAENMVNNPQDHRKNVQVEIILGQNTQNANQLQKQSTIEQPQEEIKEADLEDNQPGLSNKA